MNKKMPTPYIKDNSKRCGTNKNNVNKRLKLYKIRIGEPLDGNLIIYKRIDRYTSRCIPDYMLQSDIVIPITE